MLDGDLSLGGGSRPGRNQNPGRGPRLDGDLSIGGCPRPGKDQNPGRAPRLDGELSLGGVLGQGKIKVKEEAQGWKEIKFLEEFQG